MELEEKIELGKSLGITQAANMKEENLDKRIAEIQAEAEKPTCEVVISKAGKEFLDKIKFNLEWLESLAVQYSFSKFEYIEKFRAFRCYKEDVQVDWIDVNDLALLNGKRRLCEILLKHQPVSKRKDHPDRGCIDLPWREK